MQIITASRNLQILLQEIIFKNRELISFINFRQIEAKQGGVAIQTQ